MAFNPNHSAGWTDGGLSNHSDSSGINPPLSLADINPNSPEPPSSGISSLNYGKGALARTGVVDDYGMSPSADGSQGLPPLAATEYAQAPINQEGLGLMKVGASPFRHFDPSSDFFNTASAVRYQGEILASFQRSSRQEQPAVDLMEPSIVISNQRLNSSLLRLVGNMSQRKVETTPTEVASIAPVPAATEQGQQAIGLAIAEGEQDIRVPGQVARAVVRLGDEIATAPKAAVQAKPLDNPFQYVADQHNHIKAKYGDDSNCKYGRSLLPDGRVVEVQTAADYSSLTRISGGEGGASSMTVHDRYRRPTFEQETKPDGNWTFSQLTYADAKGSIRPFPSEKLTIHSDGTMTRSRYTGMGQVESTDQYA